LSGEIVWEFIQRLESWEACGEIWVHYLEKVLGFPQVLEPMDPQVPQAHSRGKVRGHEESRGLREEDLTPVPGGADTGSTMHVKTDVVVRVADRLAGV
jgi:hypothetical protein